MSGKFAIVLTVLTLLWLARPALASPAEAGTDESRAGMCEEYSGVTFALCVALCEARECDLQPSDDGRCAVLRQGFDRASGGVQPPC